MEAQLLLSRRSPPWIGDLSDARRAYRVIARRSTEATSGQSAAMIEVQELTKTYRHFTAVKRLSFKAEPGQITGFLGPNGAGKTTTINMILRIARAGGSTAPIAAQAVHE